MLACDDAPASMWYYHCSSRLCVWRMLQSRHEFERRLYGVYKRKTRNIELQQGRVE
jgi:hypothetical protein